MDNLNWVDYIVLAVLAISVLAGLARGFIKEVIGLVTWIVALVVATLFASPIANAFTGSSQIQSAINTASSATGMNTAHPVSMLALAISFICIFAGVVLIGRIVNYFLTTATAGYGISLVNRLLGALFGLVRGFILVVVLIFVVELTPLAQQGYWSASQFVVSFQPTVNKLGDIVQPGINSLKEKAGQTLKNVTGTVQNLTQSF